MPAHRKRTPNSDDAFFAALERGVAVKAAAALAGCSRQALYRRRITDRAFDQRWHAVEAARTMRKRLRVRRRKALPPVFEPRGRGITCKPFGDGMLLARLKTLRPGAYRESKAEAAAEREALRSFRRMVCEGTISREELQAKARLLSG